MARKIETTDDYFRNCKTAVVPLLQESRRFVHANLPGATEAMQYGVPVFLNTHGVPVIYLYGAKKHVNFGFLRSADLSDPKRILKGSGKPSKHVRLLPDQAPDWVMLKGFITQCADLKPT